MTRLLLIDTRVRDYQKIIEAAAPSVSCIIFDYDFDTLPAILARLPPGPFESVGIVQDGTNHMREYRLVANQRPADVSSENPDMNTWADIREFLTGLQTPIVDFISCMLLANPGFAKAMVQLETDLGIDLRASRDTTGNLVAGGNWVQESDGVDIKGLYFTDAISLYMNLLLIFAGFNPTTASNIKADGSNADWYMVNPAKKVLNESLLVSQTPYKLYVWGENQIYNISGSYTKIVPNGLGFAAITSTGDIVTNIAANGSTLPNNTTLTIPGPFSTISVNLYAFSALRESGNIYSWGFSSYGGAGEIVGPFTAIAATAYSFAALKPNKSIYSWGSANFGGIGDINGLYEAIAGNYFAFAALKSDKSIYSWGDEYHGGVGDISGSYEAIAASGTAFAAIKTDGSIYEWSSTSNDNNIPGVYTSIVANDRAFAALKSDKSIYSWGSASHGGVGDISGSYNAVVSCGSASNEGAFAAIKSDGSIYSWGSDIILGSSPVNITGEFSSITANITAFAALRTTGNIYSWGRLNWGGIGEITGPFISISSASNYSGGAFAALKQDESIYSWGRAYSGGIGDISGKFKGITAGEDIFYAFRQPSSNTNILSITVNGETVAVASTTNLPAATTSVVVVVVPESLAATVVIAGDTGLQPGLNTVTITVTAEDGSSTVYYIYLLVSTCCPYIARINETNTERTDHRVGNLLRQAIKDGRQPYMDASTWIRSRK